jgi:DNA helicase II / ATP-dependent DNA helicase PcrA
MQALLVPHLVPGPRDRPAGGLVSRAVTPDADGRYLRDLLGTAFTQRQLDVVTARLGPQLVIAGAGSGKTTVMAARAVHAVAHHGIAPSRILGLTFTNKAAGELADRVRRSIGALPRTETEDADDLPTVATYHSYAAQIVRDHALRIGREPTATLLTEATQWQLAMRVVQRARGPFDHLDLTPLPLAGRVVDLAGELAEHLTTAEEVRRHDSAVIAAVGSLPTTGAGARALVVKARGRDELLDLVAAYNEDKERLDTLDFADQVALAARIIEAAPEVVELERSRYDLVILDEYQDTGVAQRRLLSGIFGGSHAVTAVGDPNQAIYGWRGASVGNLLRFGEHFSPDAAVTATPLMTSFRCGGRILNAANTVAAALLTSTAAARRPKVDVEKLTAMPGNETAGEVVVSRLLTAVDEAAWLAEKVAAELHAGRPAREIAVLSRRRVDFPRLHQALLERDVPVEVVGLGGLIEMPEVADVVAMLSLLVEPTANAATVRVLTGPRWRLGVRDLAALGRRAGQLATWSPPESDSPDEPAAGEGLERALRAATDSVDPAELTSLLDAVDSPGHPAAYSVEALERVRAFSAEVRRLRELVGAPLVDLVSEVVATIGLDVEIEADEDRVAVARIANLHAFIDHAAHFTGLEGESDLSSFLAYLASANDNEDGLDVGAVSDADTVKLMTVHKAKGLEWDVVAVPGLVDKAFPSGIGRSSWLTGSQILPFACRGDADDLPVLRGFTPKDVEAFKADCKADEADEERRLAYVAFTRARSVLLLSSYCWSPTRKAPVEPSPYLEEIRALGEPAVAVDDWCNEPSSDDPNPLQAAASVDVPWPSSPDPKRAQARQAAVELVEGFRSGPTPTPGPRSEPASAWQREAALLLDELRRRRVVTVDVPLPQRLTASQVVALAADPDGFAAALARPLPRRPQPAARRGSRFHQWLEERHAGGALLDADDLPGASDPDLSDDDLEALQQRFLASEWAERRPVAVEAPFELMAGGRLIRGRIDAVYSDDDVDGAKRYDVIDYKTGAVPPDFAAASLQLSVYRLAWADLAGVEAAQVNAGFLYVRDMRVKRPAKLLNRAELAVLLSSPAA